MSPNQVEAQLLLAFFDTAGSFPVDDDCATMMREVIQRAIHQVSAADAMSPDAVDRATDTVQAFTVEMKEQARLPRARHDRRIPLLACV